MFHLLSSILVSTNYIDIKFSFEILQMTAIHITTNTPAWDIVLGNETIVFHQKSKLNILDRLVLLLKKKNMHSWYWPNTMSTKQISLLLDEELPKNQTSSEVSDNHSKPLMLWQPIIMCFNRQPWDMFKICNTPFPQPEIFHEKHENWYFLLLVNIYNPKSFIPWHTQNVCT